MNDPHVIQTKFRVPANCRHEWLLFNGNECVASISGVPGKKQVRAYFRKPSENNPHLNRLSLDWNAEAVEHLRFVCGQ